jgi:two-component system LytT family response regulator
VVFATAYDAYAVKAFDENSVDYLLKPIEAERLAKTIDKLRKATTETKSPGNAAGFNAEVLAMLQKLRAPKALSSISVKAGNKILLIGFEEISHFEAEDKYVFLITLEGQKYLTNYTISSLEDRLPDEFVRVSRANILNVNHIKDIEKHFNGKYIVAMRDRGQSKIQTGSTFGENLKRLFDL